MDEANASRKAMACWARRWLKLTSARRVFEPVPKQLQLSVRLLSGRSVQVCLPSSATCWQLHFAVGKAVGVPAAQQKLLLRNTELQCPLDSSLLEAGLQDGDDLELVCCPDRGAQEPEAISPRILRQMLKREGLQVTTDIDSISHQELIQRMEGCKFVRTVGYHRHRMEDLRGIPEPFLRSMDGKLALRGCLASAGFGAHIFRFFSANTLEAAPAMAFIDEMGGGRGLKEVNFSLDFIGGSRYVHVLPLRYQAAEEDEPEVLQAHGLVCVPDVGYSPGLSRGDSWWMLPADAARNACLLQQIESRAQDAATAASSRKSVPMLRPISCR